MIHSGVRVGPSPVAGKGLFAAKDFKRGQVICEYTGRLIYGPYPLRNRYLFAIDDWWTIDGSHPLNIGRWANHSCRPNAGHRVSRAKRIWFYALRKIKAGEEIFIDYEDEYVEGFLKGKCRCPKCRPPKPPRKRGRSNRPLSKG